MQIDGPSIPFHVAKAYGVSPSKAVTRAPTIAGDSKPTTEGAESGRGTDRADLSKIQRLVAGVVPGGIDFVEGAPARATDSSAIPLYRRPGEANAVATSVVGAVTSTGRVVDVEG
ncbi:MAG: hypothetical protein AAGI30_02490 [Planctomycetota bacterium]